MVRNCPFDASQFRADFFEQTGDLPSVLTALDHIPGTLILVKDRDSRYAFMSRSLREAIYVGTDGVVVGKTDFDLFPRIVAERFRQNDLLVLRDGRTLIDEIHSIAFVSGRAQWYLSSKWPLYGRQGDIVGLVGVDIPYDKAVYREAELNGLLPAVEHVTRSFAEKITIDDLAEMCRMSPSYFMRVFKLHMKMTAHTFLDQTRLYHAIEALKHTGQSISSIAHGCGFYDHSSFVKRFKKMTGVTPLRYRRDYKDQLHQRQMVVLPEIEVHR